MNTYSFLVTNVFHHLAVLSCPGCLLGASSLHYKVIIYNLISQLIKLLMYSNRKLNLDNISRHIINPLHFSYKDVVYTAVGKSFLVFSNIYREFELRLFVLMK